MKITIKNIGSNHKDNIWNINKFLKTNNAYKTHKEYTRYKVEENIYKLMKIRCIIKKIFIAGYKYNLAKYYNKK